MADHARAAADVPLFHGAVRGCVDGGAHVLWLDVHPVDVIQQAVPGLPDHRKTPEFALVFPQVDFGRYEGVPDDPDRVRIGQADRGAKHSRFPDPLQAGQLAVAVQPVSAGEEGLVPGAALVG